MTAIDDVSRERARQLSEEGWTLAHDDNYGEGQLARAAAAYSHHSVAFGTATEYEYPTKKPPLGWPWAPEWWKPKNRRRDLVRAAALLVAEIERLDRLESSEVEDTRLRIGSTGFNGKLMRDRKSPWID